MAMAISFLEWTNSVRDGTVATKKFVWTLKLIRNRKLNSRQMLSGIMPAIFFLFSHSYQHIVDIQWISSHDQMNIKGKYSFRLLFPEAINECIIINSKPCQCFHEFFTKSHLASCLHDIQTREHIFFVLESNKWRPFCM